MVLGKGEYLKRLTSMPSMPSLEVGRDLSGSSPPSIFIGSWNYPRVLAGPMIAPVHGECSVMDTPESWISGGLSQEQIIRYRLSLVRGKHPINATDVTGRFVSQLQEIALSESSVGSEVQFSMEPRGTTFSEDHSPFGPSAPIEHLEIDSGRWHRDLEWVYYDSDLPAKEAVVDLHRRGVPFSAIQRALSAGTMGTGRNRRLVPTRWSITACDSTLGNSLLSTVQKYPVIDTWRVHTFRSLYNTYAVILMPTSWQYEWTEAFLHILGNEELVFSDHERFTKKNGYSPLGGCYYSCKMAVLEALARMKQQAGAIILREAVQGYVPLGVFNVRENVRQAMLQPAQEYENLQGVLFSLSDTFTLPLERFMEAETLLRSMTREHQATLFDFGKSAG